MLFDMFTILFNTPYTTVFSRLTVWSDGLNANLFLAVRCIDVSRYCDIFDRPWALYPYRVVTDGKLGFGDVQILAQ